MCILSLDIFFDIEDWICLIWGDRWCALLLFWNFITLLTLFLNLWEWYFSRFCIVLRSNDSWQTPPFGRSFIVLERCCLCKFALSALADSTRSHYHSTVLKTYFLVDFWNECIILVIELILSCLCLRSFYLRSKLISGILLIHAKHVLGGMQISLDRKVLDIYGVKLGLLILRYMLLTEKSQLCFQILIHNLLTYFNSNTFK